MKLLLSKISKSYGSRTIIHQVFAQFTPGLYGILGANGTEKNDSSQFD